MNRTVKPAAELAAYQARYDAKAAREGLPARHFWADPCLEVFATERDAEVLGEMLAANRARREAARQNSLQ
jgi:hypothetical protein